MQNPRDLEGWYEQAHRIANIDSRLGVQGHYGNGNQSRSEWDMEVDCLEVIKINAMYTKPNAYLLLLITDLMIMLKGSKYFTKLDIRWGYNNV